MSKNPVIIEPEFSAETPHEHIAYGGEPDEIDKMLRDGDDFSIRGNVDLSDLRNDAFLKGEF